MRKKSEYRLPTKPMLYIAYGSNINLPQMSFRCPHSKVVGTAVVKGWELEFRGVATIVPKPDTEVPVLLWELDPRDIPALNRYEGFPHLYRQQEIEVETPDGKAKGMVYLMNRGQISPPSQGYLQTIWDGYKANGMDTSYLVEAAARAYDYASDMNIKYDESLDEDEDEDFDLDDDIQMSFKL
ncbi:MAG: gamma-glutamylcyclotransferase [Ruminococcus sp.]|nr:gamma-glutamylcyclotransferase [Ruminococcus sp.]